MAHSFSGVVLPGELLLDVFVLGELFDVDALETGALGVILVTLFGFLPLAIPIAAVSDTKYVRNFKVLFLDEQI